MLTVKSQKIRYGFAVGRVRVLETRMIGSARIRRLIEARTLDEVQRVLSETDYGSELREMADVDDAEKALNNHLGRAYTLLDESNVPPEMATYFRCRYDFLNLRVLLKSGIHNQLEAGLSVFGEVPLDHLVSTTKEHAFSGLPSHLESAAVEALRMYDISGRFDALDIALDRAYFATLSGLAAALRSRWVTEYTKLQIDLANGRIAVRSSAHKDFRDRLSRYFIKGGRASEAAIGDLFEGGVADGFQDKLSNVPDSLFKQGLGAFAVSGFAVGEYDLVADNMSIDYLLTSHRFTVGPEPVFAYIAAREHETKLLRLIISGYLSGVPVARLQERVSRIYE